MIEVVAAERRVAPGGEHLEHALAQLEDRDVECPATKVVHRVGAFGGVIQAVGDGSGGRFVQQAQHVQAGEARRILGRLPLCVVEVRRDRDDRADEVTSQVLLCALAQNLEYLGRNFDWALHTGRGA